MQAVEGGTAESSGLGNQFLALTSHLSDPHTAFLAHWIRLLDLEEAAGRAARPEIWALRGTEREASGSCVARLRLRVGQERKRSILELPTGQEARQGLMAV